MSDQEMTHNEQDVFTKDMRLDADLAFLNALARGETTAKCVEAAIRAALDAMAPSVGGVTREQLIEFLEDEDLWKRHLDVVFNEATRRAVEGGEHNTRPAAEFLADAILAAGFHRAPEPVVVETVDLERATEQAVKVLATTTVLGLRQIDADAVKLLIEHGLTPAKAEPQVVDWEALTEQAARAQWESDRSCARKARRTEEGGYGTWEWVNEHYPEDAENLRELFRIAVATLATVGFTATPAKAEVSAERIIEALRRSTDSFSGIGEEVGTEEIAILIGDVPAALRAAGLEVRDV